MAVNLSALAGAGQQFFDNSGVPLTGGKLFSYESGTTTPAVTYTTNAGTIAHTNPIILDSAGRVPSGEIWLSSNESYKFILKTSTDVLLVTWDNISGNGDPGFSSYVPSATSLLSPGPLTVKAALDDITDESTGSSVVGFMQAEAGASSITVQQKLRQVVNVDDFGAVGDGVTDDIDAIIAAHNAALVVNYTPGKIYYVEPSIGNDTKCIPILEYQTVNWNSCQIKCTNGGKTVYKIDAKSATVNRHRTNIRCNEVKIFCDRVGRTYGSTVDFEYFITISGGMIMNSTFENFSGGENLAARAIINFDYDAGVPANEAPDGITIKNMYFLGSYGVSAIVLMSGTSPFCRAGKIKFENYTLGCLDTVDYNNRSANTGKNGAIILSNASLGYSEFSFIFGGVRSLLLLDGAFIQNSQLFGLYNELIAPSSSGARAVVFTDATSYFGNCVFEAPQIYVSGTAFSPGLNYFLINATLYECYIQKPYIYEAGRNDALIPATLINLVSGSYGNTIDHLFYLDPQPVGSSGDASDFSQKFITAPVGTAFNSFIPSGYFNAINSLVLTSPGSTVLFTVPANVVETKDLYEIKCVVKLTGGTTNTVALSANTTTALVSTAVTVNTANNTAEIYASFFLQSATSKAQAATSQASITFNTISGAGVTNLEFKGPQTYTVGNNLVFSLVTTGADQVSVLQSNILLTRGLFVNLS